MVAIEFVVMRGMNQDATYILILSAAGCALTASSDGKRRLPTGSPPRDDLR
jgi:hypothetical protein